MPYLSVSGYRMGLKKNSDGETYSPTQADAVAEWILTATADNAAATVTKPGETGKNHYITSISGSFSGAAVKLMTLKQDATVKGNFHVHNQRDIVFARPVKFQSGASVELSLAASGTAGVIGAVVMTGYTLPT